eukprot:9752658-Lingulodinium_polyedra.AAC.1
MESPQFYVASTDSTYGAASVDIVAPMAGGINGAHAPTAPERATPLGRPAAPAWPPDRRPPPRPRTGRTTASRRTEGWRR